MLFFEGVNRARHHPGFTFLYHYQQYVEQSKDPYSYTQFLEHYRRKYPVEKGSMKLDHVAGQEMFIDFAGKKLQIVDRDTGEVTNVEVFVAIRTINIGLNKLNQTFSLNNINLIFNQLFIE